MKPLSSIAFRMPHTRLMRVIYTAGVNGQSYKAMAILPTPEYASSLQMLLLARGVSLRQVRGVYPVFKRTTH